MLHLKKANLWDKLLLKINLRKHFRVEGNSMTPLLYSGDRILVRPLNNYKIGEIVVAYHPIQSDLIIVKKIESIDKNGDFKLVGMNTSESSHQFGPVKKSLIFGKAVAKLD